MSQSAPTIARSPAMSPMPSRMDAATAELLATMRLNGEEARVAAVDATRRYAAADPSATLSVNRVTR
jgi:hypothetical protein